GVGAVCKRWGLVLVTVSAQGVPENARVALVDRMRDRLESVPGVTGVSYARVPPKEFWSTEPVRVAGAQQPLAAERNGVGPDYLRVLGLAPASGRELTAGDGTRAA